MVNFKYYGEKKNQHFVYRLLSSSGYLLNNFYTHLSYVRKFVDSQSEIMRSFKLCNPLTPFFLSNSRSIFS